MSKDNMSVRGMKNHIDARSHYNLSKIFWEQSDLYGVQPVKLSAIQPIEWFTSTSGEASDIVSKEMMLASRYIDKKEVGILCPEYTGPLVKILEGLGGVQHLQKNKFGYFASAYRYNRPQAGRFREFTQCGWEWFDSDEAEVIFGAWQFLEKIGWSDAVLKINNIGTEADQKNYAKTLVEFLKDKELSPEVSHKLQNSALRILDIDDVGYELPEYQISDISKFDRLLERLSDLGIKFTVDRKLVRGLDYYEETVFEFVMPYRNQTILAGGRYDRITSNWPKKSQAIGWSAGVERLLERAELPIVGPVWVVDMNGDALKEINTLRESGLSVLRQVGSDIKSWITKADNANVEWLVVIGDDEKKNQTVSWKNLKNRTSGTSSIKDFNVSRETSVLD